LRYFVTFLQPSRDFWVYRDAKVVPFPSVVSPLTAFRRFLHATARFSEIRHRALPLKARARPCAILSVFSTGPLFFDSLFPFPPVVEGTTLSAFCAAAHILSPTEGQKFPLFCLLAPLDHLSRRVFFWSLFISSASTTGPPSLSSLRSEDFSSSGLVAKSPFRHSHTVFPPPPLLVAFLVSARDLASSPPPSVRASEVRRRLFLPSRIDL